MQSSLLSVRPRGSLYFGLDGNEATSGSNERTDGDGSESVVEDEVAIVVQHGGEHGGAPREEHAVLLGEGTLEVLQVPSEITRCAMTAMSIEKKWSYGSR